MGANVLWIGCPSCFLGFNVIQQERAQSESIDGRKILECLFACVYFIIYTNWRTMFQTNSKDVHIENIRLRTHKHELIIAQKDGYTMIVMQTAQTWEIVDT